jgi:uncharacterized protein (DUF302 family)
MAIQEVRVQRFSVTSARPFEDVVAHIESGIGRPDMARFRKDITASKSFAELEEIVNGAVGPSGLMEFSRFDLGEIARKQHGGATPRSLRVVAGNPLIMKRMLDHVPDAGSYAPVTILIDERVDGVHLSYDRMASQLAPYQSEEALTVARDLDSKVESLLNAAATASR